MLNSLKSRWTALSAAQRLLVLGLACVLVTAAVGGGLAYSKPQMRNLATGLSAEAASQVVKKLEDQKVDYTLTDGGSTIQVAATDLYRVRLELAGAGLPESGGTGFELFDRVNLSSSDFAERVNFLRAMQGELAETIKCIPTVAGVRVHLNLPKESVFLDQAQPPTASVMLQLKPGQQLSRQQAMGIRNLVASAVENLKPEAVTLMDAGGSALFVGDEALGPQGSDEEERLARQLQRSVQGLLDGVAGPGRAMATVRVELDRDHRQTQLETYEPNGIEKNRVQSEEVYQGVDKRPAAGNVVRPAVTADGEKPKYSQTTNNVTYELSKKVETIEQGPGSIRRLTASVLVDANLKMPPEAVRSLREAVRAALGVDEKRGDNLEVRVVAFNREEQEKEAAELAQTTATQQVADKAWLGYVAGGVGGGFGVLVLLGSLLRRKKPTVDGPEFTVAQAEAAGGVAIELPAETPLAALPAPGSADQRSKEDLLSEARQAVREQPEAVARLIQAWLDEDRTKERR